MTQLVREMEDAINQIIPNANFKYPKEDYLGKSDPTKTILTEEEFCMILTEIRTKLQNGRL